MRKHLLLAVLFLFANFTQAGTDELDFRSNQAGDYVLGVMAHDQRSFVVSGESPEAIVGGYIKGILRTRAHAMTYAELPLSATLAEGMRKNFQKLNWLGAVSLKTTPKESQADVEETIKKAALRRTLLVTIDDVWTESYRNTSVNYKFTMAVFDDKASKLATTTYSGVHDTRAWGDDAVAEIFSMLMTQTLDKPDFRAALKLR